MKIIKLKKGNDLSHCLLINDDELSLIIDALSYASDYSLCSLVERKKFEKMSSFFDDYVY